MLKSARQIHFFVEETSFKLDNKRAIKAWIQLVFDIHKVTFNSINIIFCSDKYLLGINREFLKHDYYTDVITFPVSEEGEWISGDIYISIDRVSENTKKLKLLFNDELHRVMVHGILHLLGFGDKNKADSLIMKKMENKMLSLRSF